MANLSTRSVACVPALLVCLGLACGQATREPAHATTAIDVPAVIGDGGGTRADATPDAGDEAAPAVRALDDDAQKNDVDAAEKPPAARISTRLPDAPSDTTFIPSPIMAATRQVRAQLRRCYQSVLKSNPTVSGKLIVELQLDPSGKVTSATASSRSTLTDATMQTCILTAFRRATFPPSADGMPVTLTIPVAFVHSDGFGRDAGAPKPP